ncbi:MAG: DivIVA domain-containing protein [Actinomycetota bacterium]
MAISFSRPDPASPAAVGSATFPVNRRGYDPAEVRDFLRMVAAELARLQERERFLESELRALQTKGMSSPGRLDEETVTTLLGEEAARVLSTARDASVQIRNRAEESATRLVREAAEDAARIRESAQAESNRIRNDANSDAESEVELAKQQGRDMVFEAREYREKVLSELARRRDAARAQIEQLLHGRDRLLNAFERARIASEDVINGLEAAHDEPEMLVNLSPTTGPLPAVLPAREPNPTAPAPFDHETAVEVVSEPAVDNAAADTVEDSIEVFDVEEHVMEEPIEVVPATELDTAASESDVPFYDHALSDSELHADNDAAVHPEVSNPSNMHPSLMDGKDTSESTDETGPLATVVSLFDGRRGKKTKTGKPSIEEAHDVPTVESPVIEPMADVVVATVEPDDDTSPNQQLSKTAVDDIFKRLRASSPASVTKAVEKKKSAESSGVSSEPEPTSAPSVRKPLAVTPVVEPEKFIHRDEVLAPIIETLAKKIKRVLADEQNAILEVLESKKRKIDVDVLIGSEKVHTARHTDALTDTVMKAAMEGAKTTKTARGSVKRVTPAAVMSAMGDVLEEHLVSSMRAKLESILSDCDGDREAISEGVRNTYREWKMQRADDVAADIACASFVRGSVESLEPGTKVCWMVDPNGPACPDAEDNSLAGPTMCGEPFPTGHTMPPAHVGCRCIISPAH